MVKSKILKISLVLVMIMMMMSILSINIVNAGMYSNMMIDINSFKNKADASNIKWQNVTNEFVELGQILTVIGGGVLIAVIAYMGIKYLTSGPEGQAKLKTQLIGVVVSGVVIFGSYTIWKVVVQVASKF